MQKTLKFLPGCSNHEHANWFIGPVGHHRDSDLITKSNWEVACQRLSLADPNGIDHEVHRFGHFAVGWVEEIAYRPGSKAAIVADAIREDLEGYAILDEEHYSGLESDAENENFADILINVRHAVVKQAPDVERTLDRLDDQTLDVLMWANGIEGENDGEGWRKYSSREIDKLITALRDHASKLARKARRRSRQARKETRGWA